MDTATTLRLFVDEGSSEEGKVAGRVGVKIWELLPPPHAADSQTLASWEGFAKDGKRDWCSFFPGVSGKVRRLPKSKDPVPCAVDFSSCHRCCSARRLPGTKDIIALPVEQVNFDNGDWSVAYLISLMEEPPIQLFQKRSAAITSTGRPFSPLMPPVWTATTLSYIKDMEVLANKKPEGKAKAAPSREQEGTGSPTGSPKRKPRFPKRPKAAQEGTQ